MSSNEHSEHVVPLKNYLGVAGALFMLTIITVAVSFMDLGGFNAIVAIGIASIKALLVALVFMHLWFDKKINLFIFSVGIIVIGVFISLTMFDTLRRSDIYEIKGEPINKEAKIYQVQPDTSAISPH